jgi:hypothetical protein
MPGRILVRRLLALALVALLIAACKDATGESPLVDLANRLYLQGDWTWSDSTHYQDYLDPDDNLVHRGWYIITGAATIEEAGDSVEVETYLLAATAQLFHVDSTAGGEVERWTVENMEFEDTVTVSNDTIYGLSVEPIPPAAGANTNRVAWTLDAAQLWCTNWLTATLPSGNADGCETRVLWLRSESADSAADSTAARLR